MSRKRKSRASGPNICKFCTDWKLVDDPRGLLNFPRPHSNNWPSSFVAESPVQPVKGREVSLQALPFIHLSFESLVQSAKYAFYHCSQEENRWSKGACKGYLRTCGISEKHAEEIHTAGRNATMERNNVDYELKDSIGSFKFPHSWSGCLPLQMYIETVMHQLFLGNADSLFELCCKWASQKESIDTSSAGFKRGIQPLLRDLKLLQLSWLLVYPFNGKPTDYKTGGWVSENWLGFVRIFPVVFGWFWQDYEKGLRNGVPDLARTILSFHAFVSRCMTHGGVNTDYIEETGLYLKEFMSCLFEFDVFVRFRSPNVCGKEKEEEDRYKIASRGEKKKTGKKGSKKENVKKGSKKEKEEGDKLHVSSESNSRDGRIGSTHFVVGWRWEG
jgi:hypothetical protein